MNTITHPITVSAYADACDVSRQTIYTAIKAGDVIQREDRKIDLQNPTNALYLKNRKGGESLPVKPGPKKPEKVNQPGLDLNFEDLEEVPGLVNFENAPKSSIDKLRSLEQALTIKFNREKSRGIYIRRDRVKKYVTQLHELGTEGFKALPDRIAPDVGAIFGTEENEKIMAFNELLTNEIFSILDQVQRKLEEFSELMD